MGSIPKIMSEIFCIPCTGAFMTNAFFATLAALLFVLPLEAQAADGSTAAFSCTETGERSLTITITSGETQAEVVIAPKGLTEMAAGAKTLDVLANEHTSAVRSAMVVVGPVPGGIVPANGSTIPVDAQVSFVAADIKKGGKVAGSAVVKDLSTYAGQTYTFDTVIGNVPECGAAQ
jgi:hypothetical protein